LKFSHSSHTPKAGAEIRTRARGSLQAIQASFREAKLFSQGFFSYGKKGFFRKPFFSKERLSTGLYANHYTTPAIAFTRGLREQGPYFAPFWSLNRAASQTKRVIIP